MELSRGETPSEFRGYATLRSDETPKSLPRHLQVAPCTHVVEFKPQAQILSGPLTRPSKETNLKAEKEMNATVLALPKAAQEGHFGSRVLNPNDPQFDSFMVGLGY